MPKERRDSIKRQPINMDTEKAIRLISYLEELTRLRVKAVKSIDSYQKILWLKDVPKNSKYCFTRAWGPNEEIDSDIWILIKN